MRNRLRGKFFAFVRHLSALDENRQIFCSMLRLNNLLVTPAEFSLHHNGDAPYPELSRSTKPERTRLRSDIIFITGRFRSGSTLLWNLFRNVEAVTAYYEPFNERRWFDPATRGGRVDPTHLNVREYWAEYDGLDVLGKYYSEDWTRRQLYMNAHAWNPDMQRYIETLVEGSRGRPVLQFNRVDLRLPWLRYHFPHAKILHIFRHPRDNWCSTLGRQTTNGSNLRLGNYQSLDGFYLLTWGLDLRHYFPFLTLDEESHPYELFYQIWKLSYLFGRAYSDMSISFEEILGSPESTIRNVLSGLSVESYDLAKLGGMVSPVATGTWKRLADDQWFKAIEERVDNTINDYLGYA
ncbi:MAG: sulfotransferase [Nitrososphaera sp.]